MRIISSPPPPSTVLEFSGKLVQCIFRHMSIYRTVLRRSARLASRYPTSRAEDDESDFFWKLIKFFKRYTKLSKPRDEIKCIRRSLQYFSCYLYNERLAKMYIEAIFAVIEIFRITNSIVIGNSVIEFFMRCYMLCPILEPPLLLEPVSRCDIYCRCPVHRCAKDASVSFIYNPNILEDKCATQRLLRFGFLFQLKESNIHNFLDHWLTYLLMQTAKGTGLLDYRTSKLVKYVWTAELEEELRTALKEHYKTDGSQRRLYFILLAIHLLGAKNDVKLCKDLTCSLKILFKSVPDPLISVTEIIRFFNFFLDDETERNAIRNYCNRFLEDFPKSGAFLQPRSLKHLSRCVVRECLAQSRKLPHGVWSLNIPKKVQNYILMQKTEDEFFNDYVRFLDPKSETCKLPTRKKQKTA